MNKFLFGVIGLLLIGAFFFGVKELAGRSSGDSMRDVAASAGMVTTTEAASTTPVSSETPAEPTSAAAETAPTQAPGTYTMTQISTHNSASNCWSAIAGSVYDLTAWVGKHPGGKEAIKKLCGKDGTALFEGQHGGMEKQAAVLATFKIGALAQ